MPLRPWHQKRIAGITPILVIPVIFVAFAGCAPHWPEDYPARFEPVTGKVMIDGKPIAHVQVNFVPMREGGLLATGETDGNGRYRLSYQTQRGTPVGEYRVILSYRTDPQGVPITKAMGSTLLMPRELIQAVQRLPERYSTKDSVLRATVIEGDNVIDFSIEGSLKPIAPQE